MRFEIPRLAVLVVTAIYAAAFFFWLGFEDVDTRLVTAMGTGLTLLAGLHWLQPGLARGFDRRQWLRTSVLGGAILGLAAAPLTAILMAVKVSLHSHGTPDFQPAVVLAVLRLTPIWGLAGLLLGTAAWLLSRVGWLAGFSDRLYNSKGQE